MVENILSLDELKNKALIFSNKKFKNVLDNIEYTYSDIVKLAEENDNTSDLMILNKIDNLFFVKLIDYKKFIYEKKKQEKLNLKKQKFSVQKLKEVQFKLGIASNDRRIKVKHIKEFLADNCKVKVVVVIRGREKIENANSMLIDILTELDKPVKNIKTLNRSVFSVI